MSATGKPFQPGITYVSLHDPCLNGDLGSTELNADVTLSNVIKLDRVLGWQVPPVMKLEHALSHVFPRAAVMKTISRGEGDGEGEAAADRNRKDGTK